MSIYRSVDLSIYAIYPRNLSILFGGTCPYSWCLGGSEYDIHAGYLDIVWASAFGHISWSQVVCQTLGDGQRIRSAWDNLTPDDPRYQHYWNWQAPGSNEPFMLAFFRERRRVLVQLCWFLPLVVFRYRRCFSPGTPASESLCRYRAKSSDRLWCASCMIEHSRTAHAYSRFRRAWWCRRWRRCWVIARTVELRSWCLSCCCVRRLCNKKQ